MNLLLLLQRIIVHKALYIVHIVHKALYIEYTYAL